MNPRTDGLHRAASGLGGSRVRTIFLGSGGFGGPSLKALANDPHIDLVGVVTAPPRPAGRQQRLERTRIHEIADGLDGPDVLTPSRLRDPDAVAAVQALEPGLLVLADYGRIVPGELLEVEHGALNLHPSLLPRHRGATPIPAAILANDRETGVTVIRMDAGVDTGPIVASRRAKLDDTDTAKSLHARLSVMARDLLQDTIGPWLAGAIEARPQHEASASMTSLLRREDGRLDPGRPARELERQIRAYDPWPGSFIETPRGRLVIWGASVDDAVEGEVGSIDARGLVTAHGRLAFEQVQPAGGRRMSWAEYLRGGARLVGSSIVG